jgi:PBP1b-binding outer membrane lipoprotein LpoB
MQKLITNLILFLSIILLSSCSTDTSTFVTEEIPIECEKIRPSLTPKLVSPNKFDQISGWQLMLDYPSCFPGGNFELAKSKIEALKNQK